MAAGVLLLAALVVFVYWPATHGGFLMFDDQLYVTENAHVLRGLSSGGLRWALTSFDAANWHPLTWISHMIDVEMFGLDPGRHHLVGVLLHAASACLLLRIVAAMTGAFWPSAVLAGFFAFHPLHVESVAWVAERKDLLSGIFLWLTLAAYLRYVRGRSLRRYALLLVLFGLGLMAKPMLVTLPPLLLLLDFWPLGRLQGPFAPAPLPAGSSGVGALIVEKLPLLALSAASSLITMKAQTSTIVTFESLPLAIRVENALVTSVLYLRDFFYPLKLAALYPHPEGAIPSWQIAGALLILALASATAVAAAGRRPFLLFGWCWYLVALIPVIGLVQVGTQSRADRYTYIPITGLFVAIIWAFRGISRRQRRLRRLVALAAAVGLVACAVIARAQIVFWKDSVTLFQRAVSVTRGNWLAELNLGVALEREGRVREAADHYRQLLAIRPAYSRVHALLGTALLKLGDVDGALPHLVRALLVDPRSEIIHYNTALAFMRQGKMRDADQHLRQALLLKPDYRNARAALEDVQRRVWGDGGKAP